MNIENIEAFVYVIHYGSFNKAAEALYLSQPSVTARIQSLERELDCRLFDRTGKQIRITEEGKRFLPYAQQLILTYQKGKLHINQKKSLPAELKIGCTVSVSNYVIPELLPRLKRKFPGIQYRFVTGTTDDRCARWRFAPRRRAGNSSGRRRRIADLLQRWHDTLRGNLGLPIPENRYTAARRKVTS